VNPLTGATIILAWKKEKKKEEEKESTLGSFL